MKKNYIKVITIILVSIIGIFLTFRGITFARYVGNKIWDYTLRSNGFYFYSDQLDINDKDNSNSKWNFEPVYFNLKNNQNDAIITDYDISYEISCEVKGDASEYYKCQLNGTTNDTYSGVLSAYQSCVNNTEDLVNVDDLNKTECELGGYTWKKQAANQEYYFELIKIKEGSNIEEINVNVLAKSSSPYIKSLKGNFSLTVANVIAGNSSEQMQYSYVDYGEFGRLTATNQTTNATYALIYFPESTFLLNENINLFESYTTAYSGNINRITMMIPRNSSKSIIFYKKDPARVTTIDDFIIGKGIPYYLPSYVAGVYQGDETNLYVGNLEWQNDKLLLNGVDQGIEIYDNDADYSNGITMVIYFQRYQGINAVQNLIMKRSVNTNGYFMYIDGLASDVIKIDTGGSNNRYITPITIENNISYHIVYAWNPTSKGKLYLNGELVGTYASGSAPLLSSAGNVPIKVGFDKDGVFSGNKYPYWGEIKAMNIYNEALTASEVWDIYQRDISFD